MLAYRLPVPVYYHIPTVIFSLVAAICASFIALFVVSRERVTILNIVAGGLLMAAGISTMHYTGMAAMRLSAMHHYDGRLVLVSLAIALFVSWAALGLTFQFRDDTSGGFLKLLCAIIMGFAIPAMHYTAMAAVTYTHAGGAGPLLRAGYFRACQQCHHHYYVCDLGSRFSAPPTLRCPFAQRRCCAHS